MILVACSLLALGVSDLVRGTVDRPVGLRTYAGAAAGASVAVLVAALAYSPQWPWLLLGWPLVWIWLAAWSRYSVRAVASTVAYQVPLLVLAAPIAAAVLVSGQADASPARWSVEWLRGLPFEGLEDVSLHQVLVTLGVVLVLVNTSNVVVRTVLQGAGVPAGRGEAELKGGRLLGPMERVFIFCLALAGDLTAASVVVAAKSLLRFPEVRFKARKNPTDPITEYFVLGSFTSWLLALVFVPLVKFIA